MVSFVARYNLELERCWIAENAGRFQGSVVVCEADAREIAKIRVLLVEPKTRGWDLRVCCRKVRGLCPRQRL